MNDARPEVIDYVRNRIIQGPAQMERMAVGPSRDHPLRPRRALAGMLDMANDFFNGGVEHMMLITGIRGAGKSTLLSQIYVRLRGKGVPADRMIYISMDETMLALGAGILEVFDAFQQLVPQDFVSIPSRDIVLILDEVQYDARWSQALKVIYDRAPDLLILATGSSALQLREQGDLARRGRFIELPPLPLGEYLEISDEADMVLKGRDIASALFDPQDAAECHAKLMTIAPPGGGMDVGQGTLVRYLTHGSLPMARGRDASLDLRQRYLQLLEKVIFIDMPGPYSFDRETSLRISHMTYLLADSDQISYEKIGTTVGLSKGTISLALRGLEQAGIIVPLRSRGGEYARRRTTPRYKFTAPAMRGAILERLGRPLESPVTYGRLLEDAIVERVHELIRSGVLTDMWYETGTAGIDLMVRSRDGKEIGIEIGWGKKDSGQRRSIPVNKECKYYLIASATGLQRKEDVVFIPREYILLT
jgi:predicted AAA+ superfamily ATPase